MTPDRLTLLGLLGAFLTGASYVACHWSAWFLLGAVAGLAINWAGDSLDGTLARTRGQERPIYGYFVDHTTDLASQVFMFLGMGLSPYLRFEGACLILLSYWLAALLSFIRAAATQVFHISYFGIGPTEIRIALALYSIAVLVWGPLILPGIGITLIDAFSYALFPVVFATFGVMVWRESRDLADRDAVDR